MNVLFVKSNFLLVKQGVFVNNSLSHSIWVRGLKYFITTRFKHSFQVALYMGAWIEISSQISVVDFIASSHSIWVRGLKSVAKKLNIYFTPCRTLYGCVD